MVNIASTDYAAKAKCLMKIAQTLKSMGAQAFIDVPKIAVIGGQSAGKSSLVEAVSDIRVPRDSGTCTRCPMEVNLISEPGPWSCSISLRFEYDAIGICLPTNEFRTVKFGPVLESIEDVELALRQAQVAILNPDQKAESFLSKTIEELQYYRTARAFASGTLKFSKNTVVVEIKSEDGVNLSFVDLPGLIQNEEPQIVQIVEDLVKSNIAGNCLILVTIPMSDDIENQRAMRLALETDKEKARTIGVLTKPDTLSVGAVSARQKWRDLITGDDTDPTHRLRHGYYCVKLPDDAERANSPTRSERILAESLFFQSTAPWNEVGQERFGVQHLVVDLSRHLTDLLDRTLPKLRDQAEKQLIGCRERLAQLPQELRFDASTEVLGRITEFSQEFAQMALGNGIEFFTGAGTDNAIGNDQYSESGKSFVQNNRTTYEKFKVEIRRTAPDFRPFVDWELYDNPFDSQRFNGGSEDEEATGVPRDLSDVRKIIKSSLKWELPNNVPFEAKRELIKEITRLWDRPALSCFETVAASALRALDFCINKHFSRFPKLKSHIRVLVMELYSTQKQKALDTIKDNLSLEKYPLFTMNDHYLSSTREKWLLKYRQARKKEHKYRLASESPSASEHTDGRPTSIGFNFLHFTDFVYFALTKIHVPDAWRTPIAESEDAESPLDRALTALRELGYKNLVESDLDRLIPPDEYEEELVVMADVRAYFQVAYKRLVDYIPLTIEHVLNQNLAQALMRSLIQKLQLGSVESSERLEQLIAEDPEIAFERKELLSSIGSLEKVVDELRTLQT